MKNKYKIIVFFIIMLISSSVLVPVRDTNAKGNEMVVIPKKAVRLRILANSDSSQDQALKRKVRDAVNAQINTWVKDLTSFEEGQKVIKSHIPDLEKTVKQVIKEQGSTQTFTITYSKKVKFPTKLYGSFLYPAGNYEAVLIKLGAGQGANWWCVLFPPLCFLDFSNGDAATVQSLQSQQKVEKETAIVHDDLETGKGFSFFNKEKAEESSSNSDEITNNTNQQDNNQVVEAATQPHQEIKVESFFLQMMKKLF